MKHAYLDKSYSENPWENFWFDVRAEPLQKSWKFDGDPQMRPAVPTRYARRRDGGSIGIFDREVRYDVVGSKNEEVITFRPGKGVYYSAPASSDFGVGGTYSVKGRALFLEPDGKESFSLLTNSSGNDWLSPVGPSLRRL